VTAHFVKIHLFALFVLVIFLPKIVLSVERSEAIILLISDSHTHARFTTFWYQSTVRVGFALLRHF